MRARLPNFLVIGAAKSGTTSLHYYLEEHPDVYVPAVKETNFFAYVGTSQAETIFGKRIEMPFPVKTFAEYSKLYENADCCRAIGEVSPLYLISNVAADRIKKCLGDAKIVVILRNPIKAAYSAYIMQRKGGKEQRCFEDIARDASQEHITNQYQYAKALARWLDLFPLPSLKVLLFENLKARPRETIGELYDFIGVDRCFTPRALGVVYNQGGIPRNAIVGTLFREHPVNLWFRRLLPSKMHAIAKRLVYKNFMEYPEISREAEERLADFYRSDVAELSALVGMSFKVWGIEMPARTNDGSPR